MTTQCVYKYFAVATAALVFTLAACASDVEPASRLQNDMHAIKAVINNTYDTPQQKVQVDPVAVAGNYAVASWLHADKGGRAVLARTPQNTWEIMLCSGKAVMDSRFLQEAGIPQENAEKLVNALASAESVLPPARIALYDSFSAVVMGKHNAQHHGDHHASGDSGLHKSHAAE